MEYAEKNPHRIPKIARRLERKAMDNMHSADSKVHLVDLSHGTKQSLPP